MPATWLSPQENNLSKMGQGTVRTSQEVKRIRKRQKARNKIKDHAEEQSRLRDFGISDYF